MGKFTRQQQLIREAEGYLELLLVFADQWPVKKENGNRLAQRAIETLGRLGDLGGQQGHVDYLRGQAFRLMNCHRKAIECLQRAAGRDPANTRIHVALGWCYKRIGRLDLAIQALEEGLAVDPDQGIIHYNLACYWSLAKNTRLALEYLANSIDLDPSYRDLIAAESDFDPIRNDPGFVALATSTV